MEPEPFSYYIKGSIGTILSIFHKMGGKIVVVINTYGARDMFLLFCDCQDTESE